MLRLRRLDHILISVTECLACYIHLSTFAINTRTIHCDTYSMRTIHILVKCARTGTIVAGQHDIRNPNNEKMNRYICHEPKRSSTRSPQLRHFRSLSFLEALRKNPLFELASLPSWPYLAIHFSEGILECLYPSIACSLVSCCCRLLDMHKHALSRVRVRILCAHIMR